MEIGNMRHALRAVFILLLAFLIAADDVKKAAKKEQEKLQGSWKVVSSEKDGKPHECTKDAEVVFDGDKLNIQLIGEKPGKGAFKLDPSKDPKWIDCTILGRGIYNVDGDTLRICWGEERPSESVSKKNVYLLVLKRTKP
jgi:uncharacterized protein (TIGR03067 family)